jgi:hypothetical protein
VYSPNRRRMYIQSRQPEQHSGQNNKCDSWRRILPRNSDKQAVCFVAKV